MPNIVLRRIVMAATLASLVAVELRAQADDKPSEKLTLKSGYSGKMLVEGGRKVSLSVALDGKGNGSGTLRLDPNIHEGNTSTQIAIHEISIQLRLIPDEGQAAKGRRLYELRKVVMDDSLGRAKVEPVRWLLVRPV